mgnify:CR=1 FL=1
MNGQPEDYIDYLVEHKKIKRIELKGKKIH